MRICLISLPMTWNYGGILQQYSLQEHLVQNGHLVDVMTIRKNRNCFIANVAVKVKWKFIPILARFLGFKYSKLFEVERFKQNHFTCLTRTLLTNAEIAKFIDRSKYDCLIVGSDQIWNRDALPNLRASFLDFNVEKKIAYAPSFARNEHTYSDSEIKIVSQLLTNFFSVSVREKSGVAILSEQFNCASIHVLDPTFLLSAEDYKRIFVKELSSTPQPIEKTLFTYILDGSTEKKLFTRKVAKQRGLIIDDFISRDSSRSVEAWLKGIYSADFVITDSFHGMCFAIIFKKQFFVIENASRGSDRFISMLTLVGLSDRLIPSSFNAANCDYMNSEIAWDEVSTKLRLLIDRSREFLENLD